MVPAPKARIRPTTVMAEFGAVPSTLGSLDISVPDKRLRDLDALGIDAQLLFPSSLYACMGDDPFFEAAMFRAYNRYAGRQCRVDSQRLKWAGLLPLRDSREAIEALREMQELGASTAVVFGTVGERLLSHKSFTPIWDEFARTGLPLCVHMGRSYPPFDQLVETRLEAHVIAMGMPAQLGFVALVAQGMLDRYQNLKVAFLEFGAEWLFYVVGRLAHYLPSYRSDPTVRAMGRLPEKAIEEYLTSGRFFIAPEADDPLLLARNRPGRRRAYLVLIGLPPWRGPRQCRQRNIATQRSHRRAKTQHLVRQHRALLRRALIRSNGSALRLSDAHS